MWKNLSLDTHKWQLDLDIEFGVTAFCFESSMIATPLFLFSNIVTKCMTYSPCISVNSLLFFFFKDLIILWEMWKSHRSASFSRLWLPVVVGALGSSLQHCSHSQFLDWVFPPRKHFFGPFCFSLLLHIYFSPFILALDEVPSGLRSSHFFPFISIFAPSFSSKDKTQFSVSHVCIYISPPYYFAVFQGSLQIMGFFIYNNHSYLYVIFKKSSPEDFH